MIEQAQKKELMPHGEAGRGERGMALILCIGFLALLSILGTVVLDLTNTGLNSTTVDKVAKNVFSTADRAVEYSLSPQVYASLLDEGDQVDLTEATHADWIEATGSQLAEGRVTYEGFGGAPTNAGKYDKKATAGKVYRYFHVSVVSQSNNPRFTKASYIDAQLVQAFPAVTNVPVEYASGKQDGPGAGGN